MKVPNLLKKCTGKSKDDPDTREYREAFDLIDLNGDGLVSATELQQYFSKLGTHFELSEAERMIFKVDTNKNGLLDFSEFLTLLHTDVIDKDTQLRKAFNAYDTDGSGKISRRELGDFFKRQMSSLTQEEIDDLMVELDANRDGEIDFEEFKKMME